MGISDYHIRKIKKVSESRLYCPECGKQTLYCETETGDYEDFELCYCPKCKIFFEHDDGYFTGDDTEGLEKLQVKRKRYGFLIMGRKRPIYFDTIEERKKVISLVKGITTYSTFTRLKS